MLNFDVAASAAPAMPATLGGKPDDRAAATGGTPFDQLLAQLAGATQASCGGAADPKATAAGKDAKKTAFDALAGRKKAGDAPADAPPASDEGRQTAAIATALGGFLNLDPLPPVRAEAVPATAPGDSPVTNLAIAGAAPDGGAAAIGEESPIGSDDAAARSSAVASAAVTGKGASANAAALNVMPGTAADSAATPASGPPASATRTGDPRNGGAGDRSGRQRARRDGSVGEPRARGAVRDLLADSGRAGGRLEAGAARRRAGGQRSRRRLECERGRGNARHDRALGRDPERRPEAARGRVAGARYAARGAGARRPCGHVRRGQRALRTSAA